MKEGQKKFKVKEVTHVQSQQPGCIDNKIWRKRMNESMNQSLNDEAVCRIAPATPGLFKI